MLDQISLADYQKAEREILIKSERMDFIIHCIIYAVVNAVLITLDVLYTPEVVWFYGPLVVWTLVITAHYFFAIRWVGKSLERREKRIESRVQQRRK